MHVCNNYTNLYVAMHSASSCSVIFTNIYLPNRFALVHQILLSSILCLQYNKAGDVEREW